MLFSKSQLLASIYKHNMENLNMVTERSYIICLDKKSKYTVDRGWKVEEKGATIII